MCRIGSAVFFWKNLCRPNFCTSRRGQELVLHAFGFGSPRSAPAHESDAIAGAQLSHLPEFGLNDDNRTNKAPRLGPSTARMTGMSPVKSTAPIA